MSEQHTPKPWVARPDPNACLPDDWCVGTGPENIDKVAVCSKCDAQLISAAPDLYEACKALIAYCDKNPPMGESLWSVQLIREAIKKAEGEV
jgi:hypothetical protein